MVLSRPGRLTRPRGVSRSAARPRERGPQRRRGDDGDAKAATAPILVDEPAEGVKRITLNRPEALNAFSFEMYEAFIAALEGLRHDPDTRVIILTGAGRGFCAGHDTKGAGKAGWVRAGARAHPVGQAHHGVLGQIPPLMRAMPQPIIAAVNGAAAGIGYALALAADLCLAAQSAKFVNVIHNAATGAELGMSYMLPRAVGTQRAASCCSPPGRFWPRRPSGSGWCFVPARRRRLMDEALKLADADRGEQPDRHLADQGIPVARPGRWAAWRRRSTSRPAPCWPARPRPTRSRSAPRRVEKRRPKFTQT